MLAHRLSTDAIMSWGAGLLRGVLDLACPPRCPLCGVFLPPDLLPEKPSIRPAGPGFCPECLSRMTPTPHCRCLKCGIPFETDLPEPHTCGKCLLNPPPYHQASSAGLYEDELRRAVHKYKYEGRVDLAAPLADFMREHLSTPFYPPQVDLILPIPLHPRRLRERGFNQSLVLARSLFKEDLEKIRTKVLVRSRYTTSQAGLRGADRRRNVRGVFAVSNKEAVKGRSVMILDDIHTTGATAAECSRTVLKAGAWKVLVLTLARVKLPT